MSDDKEQWQRVREEVEIELAEWRRDLEAVGADEDERPRGWICPRCQKVHAPHVDRCDCKPKQDSASVGPSEFK